MTDRTQSETEIDQYGERFNLTEYLDKEYFVEYFQERDEILETLDSVAPTRTADIERDHWAPDDKEDPFGAFLTCSDIQKQSGPLDDLNIAVKDNIAVADLPMTCGSPLLEDFVPEHDGTVVERLLQAGGRIIGKANMDEFASGGGEATMRFKLARNPVDSDYKPGGSSAGSAVAVGAKMADVALGTDTGGSVRFPASFCGVVGLKPTRGLVSHHGMVQYSKVLDTIGTLSRDTRSSARVLEAMAGADPKDPCTHGVESESYVDSVDSVLSKKSVDLTLGIPKELFGQAPEIDSVIESALDDLEENGAKLRDTSIEHYKYAVPAWLAISGVEVSSYVEESGNNYWQPGQPDINFIEEFHSRLSESADVVGERIIESVFYGAHIRDTYPDYYARAQRARQLVTDGIDTALSEVDVLVSPTVPLLPGKWGEGHLNGEEDIQLADIVGTTAPFNLSGHPAVTVPCGTIDGLPVGVQFIGEHFDESRVLQAATLWQQIYSGKAN